MPFAAVRRHDRGEPSGGLVVMTSTILLTGFPGFLARRLVRRLHEKRPEASWVFLVQEHLRQRAEDDLAAIAGENPGFAGRWETVSGDIGDPRLGLSEEGWGELAGRVREVWHLAAVYDLAVPEAVARRVNVDGTRHVLDFCAACRDFRRLCYVSTCYVAGDGTGRVLEGELDRGQGFKNHYESTKFEAELEVQRRWDRIPAVVFRPAVVVGDSRTGETDKYDGPYYFIRLMMHLPRLLPMLGIGRGGARLNVVPVDFVIAAMVEISGQEGVDGRVFQLADPAAVTSAQLLDLISLHLGKPRPPFAVPAVLFDAALAVGALRRTLGIPRETVVYANHDVRYDVQNTLDALEGTGVECPPIHSYLPTLIDYVRHHPDQGFLDRRFL
jgi:thioester reductase-like protein